MIHGPVPAPVPQAVIVLKLMASMVPDPSALRLVSLLP